MRTIKNSLITLAILAAAMNAQAVEPLNADSLKLFGMEKVSKPAPYQMLKITVANFQVELCAVPATETEPLRLARKELCSK